MTRNPDSLLREIEVTHKERQTIMDSLGDMIILTDDDGLIKSVNKATTDFTGRRRDDVVGRAWEEVIHESGLEAVSMRSDTTELYHSATRKWFALNAYPFEDSRLNFSGNIITLHDSTEIKHMADKLAKSNRKLAENRNSLKEALEQITRVMKDMADKKKTGAALKCACTKESDIVGDAPGGGCACNGHRTAGCGREAPGSHNGQPLYAVANKDVRYSLSSVSKEEADPVRELGEQFNNMRKMLETKNRALEEANTKINNANNSMLCQWKMASIGRLTTSFLHELSKPIQNREETQKTVHELLNFIHMDETGHIPAHINTCMESTLNIVRSELKRKAIVECMYGELPLTECRPRQLMLVFMNLLINAADAIEERGKITVKTWSADGTICVSISDTGRGIHKEQLSRIFEPFFTTKEMSADTGLGLSISYDIVKRHDGDITVESHPGRGSTFTVSIPVVGGN